MIELLNTLLFLSGYAAHVTVGGIGFFIFAKSSRRPLLSVILFTVLVGINTFRPLANDNFIWLWLGTLGAFVVGQEHPAWARRVVPSVASALAVAVIAESALTFSRPFIVGPGASASILLFALPFLSGRWTVAAAWGAVLFTQSRAAWMGALIVKLGKHGAWTMGVLTGVLFCLALLRPETVTVRLSAWGEAINYIAASPLPPAPAAYARVIKCGVLAIMVNVTR